MQQMQITLSHVWHRLPIVKVTDPVKLLVTHPLRPLVTRPYQSAGLAFTLLHYQCKP